MEVPEYFKLSEEHSEAAARIYSRAFTHDPLFSFLLPKKKSRERTLFSFFKPIVNYKIKFGEIYGVGTPLQGVATWTSPKGKKKESLRGVMETGLWKLLFSPFVLTAFRGGRLGRTTKKLHKKYAPNDHYYLDMLSVDPDSHGQGFSSKLVKPMLEVAKEKDVPVYLETSNPRNVEIYEHFGFTLVEHLILPRSELNIWALLKKP